MMTDYILYTAKICPWAHRAELASQEAKLNYKRVEIDLKNKPTWYAPKINPASKVPALVYGAGPNASYDNPPPESQKLAESYVLLEFIADISNSLLPKDPVQRAKARFFIETAGAKFIPTYYAAVSRGEPVTKFLEGVEVIQGLLPPQGFAVGEWSIADAAILPFLARAEVALKNDYGAYDEGTGPKAWETLQTDPKFARFRQYYADNKARDSFKNTFDEDYITKDYFVRYSAARAQRSSSVTAKA